MKMALQMHEQEVPGVSMGIRQIDKSLLDATIGKEVQVKFEMIIFQQDTLQSLKLISYNFKS